MSTHAKTLRYLALERGEARGCDPDAYAVGYLGSLLDSVEAHLRAGRPELALTTFDVAREALTPLKDPI